MNRVIEAIKRNRDKKGITKKDWLIILEETVRCLKPHLSTFANTPLGHVRLWGSGGGNEGCRETIETDLTGVDYDPQNLPLSTHGFWQDPQGPTLNGPNEVVFWGLTRKGEWAVVKLLAQTLEGKNSAGQQFRRHKAIAMINAKICDVEEITAICGWNLYSIWDSLYIALYRWNKRREELAQEANSCYMGIEGVKEIIDYFIK